MKKVLMGLCTFFTVLFFATSCNESYTTYGGPGFISFSDSLYVLPVQNNEEVFDIPVVAAQSCGYDRTLAVEVLDKKTNAVEGKHFSIESNTITIPAGELTANFRIKGNADNITINDSLGIKLHILTENAGDERLQSLEANVLLVKTCPLDMNDFTGYCILKSPYMNQYMSGVKARLVRSELDPEHENTIILKDYFYDGYDVRLRFTANDLLNPLLEMDEQPFGPTSEAFGTVYGDGVIYMQQMMGYPSYYSTCEHFLVHYTTLFVPEVGTIGSYFNVVEFISDDEAERIQREGF